MEAGRPRRPSARGCARRLVSAAAVFGRPALLGRAQEPEFSSPLDFGLVGVATQLSTEQVAIGKVWLYGQMTMALMQDVAAMTRLALSMICSPLTGDAMGMLMPVTSYATQDILTLNKRIVGIRIDFRMLAALDGGIPCIDKISEMTAGPESPPFSPIPESPFRKILSWEMARHRPTRDLDTGTWRIRVDNITCRELAVVRPSVFPRAPPEPYDPRRPQNRQCDGEMIPEIDWASLAAGAWQSPGRTCRFAPSPCVCAAIPGCGWFPSVGASGECRSGGPVDCAFCPVRAGCAPSRSELCAAELTACTCAVSTGDCRWDDAAKRCIVREPNRFTPCSSCARQAFCPALLVDSIRPQQLSVMGKPDIGWLVNVTFSRQVWLVPTEASVRLACAAAGGPAAQLPVPVGQLSMERETLVVDLRAVTNVRSRDCDLVIGTGTVRDRDHVPFGGHEAGKYTITFPDTAAPVLQRFQPANSAKDVPLDASIVFGFDEAVMLGPGAAYGNIALVGLGVERAGGSREADVLVASLALTGPEVSFNGRLLRVDLKGHVQPNVLYSLSIPPAAVADRSGNAFAGLETSVYAFRTMAGNQGLVVDTGLTTEAVIGIVVASCAVFALAVSVTCISLKMRSMRQRMSSVAEEPSTVPSGPLDVDAHYAWGGEKVADLQVHSAQGESVTGRKLSLHSQASRQSSQGFPVSGSWNTSPMHRSAKSGSPTQRRSLQSSDSVTSGKRAAGTRSVWGREEGPQAGAGEAQQPGGLRAAAASGSLGRSSPVPPPQSVPNVINL